jgi:hypothetical protein
MRRFTVPVLIFAAAIAVLAFARAFIPSEQFDWPAWVQAVGSIAAILVTAWIPFLQKQDAIAAEKEKGREDARRICLAVRDELSMLQGMFIKAPNVVALLALQPGEIFDVLVPVVVPGERFSIYRAVVGRLTLIDDDQLRQEIIWAYEFAIGMIHAGLQNNRLITEARELDRTTEAERFQFQLEQLKISAVGMQFICKQTIERVNALLPALDRATGRA